MRQKNPNQWAYDNFVQIKSVRRAQSIREQLLKYMKKYKIPLESALSGYASKLPKQREFQPLRKPQNEPTPAELQLKDASMRIRKCILHGFFENIAQRQTDGTYKTVKGQVESLFMHPSSVLFKFPPEWVCFTEVIQTNKLYMRDVMSIEPQWLAEVAPHYYEWKRVK